jgi:hypothetical protein
VRRTRKGLCTQPPRKRGQFSEVQGSKRPLERGGKHPWAASHSSFGVETGRLRTVRCIFVYQGVAPRNCATTREILVHLIGAYSAPERLDEARHSRGVRTGPERFQFATRTHTAGKRGWKPQAKPWSRPTRHLREGTALPSPRTGDHRRRTRRPPSRTSSIVGLACLSPLAEGRESSPGL